MAATFKIRMMDKYTSYDTIFTIDKFIGIWNNL